MCITTFVERCPRPCPYHAVFGDLGYCCGPCGVYLLIISECGPIEGGGLVNYSFGNPMVYVGVYFFLKKKEKQKQKYPFGPVWILRTWLSL